MRPWAIHLAATAALLCPGVANAEPLDKPVTGPQLVCFKYSTFKLGKGERITDVSPGGPEDIILLVETPRGGLRVMEGEVWGEPRQEKERILQQGQTTVYRIVIENEPRYAIYGPLAYEKHKLVIWVSGPALVGNDKDIEIVSRFIIEDTDKVKCRRQFTYSW